MKRLVVAGLFSLVTSLAVADTAVVLKCTAPTTRDDAAHTPLAQGDIKTFSFYKDGVKVAISPGLICGTNIAIPQGTCIPKTAVFTATATDQGGLESVPSVGVSLLADSCNPFPLAAPTGLTITTVK